MNTQFSLSVRLKSSDKNILLTYKNFLLTFFDKRIISTVFSLPVKKKKITLLKSPHVYKKAKEQFEIRYYTTVILFKNLSISPDRFNYLLLNKPSSISLVIKQSS